MIPTASFWSDNSDLISAVVTMGVAIAIAFAVDRLAIARAGHVAAKVGEGPLSRARRPGCGSSVACSSWSSW